MINENEDDKYADMARALHFSSVIDPKRINIIKYIITFNFLCDFAYYVDMRPLLINAVDRSSCFM